ncbi:hypothetical protein [Cobetia sp. 1CM21F]|uniref:hypothetical protein n=1 Tax=Cobetia sp. 1CM21F TaxID=2929163 RepID=UPI0020C0DF07|nr:hypothetical protein [Cobetia sp. 1CM21F]MCK8066409.1 hypothetical protein [Cobetia sp. 1CM21F]
MFIESVLVLFFLGSEKMPPAVLIQKRPLAKQGEISPSAFQIRASGATRPAGDITLYQKNLWFQL